MDLLPPRQESLRASSLDVLVRDLQAHAAKEGYAVVKKRTKQSAKNWLVYKAWLQRDGGGDQKDLKDFGKRTRGTSRPVDGPFLVIAKEQYDIYIYYLHPGLKVVA